MKHYRELKNRINSRKAKIAIMGLGYVGLPMAMEFCLKGFRVNGLDSNANRIKKLEKGVSYISDIPSRDIKSVFRTGDFYVTTDESILDESDVVIVCVPTPLRKTQNPDISYVLSAAKTLARHLHRGQLIVLESTTYPGTTRDVILPALEKGGLKLDKDFYLAFSPERIDPGNEKYNLTTIPKVVGGFTKEGTELSRLLYSKIIKKVIGVSSPEAAEVTKLLENTFRIVNIGLINEFATLCNKLGIDVWEVIEAARTKPFGFMPFYPGPGIGGHCIPADPMYLSWKARKIGFETRMVDIAAKVNRDAPRHMISRINAILRKHGRGIAGARVFLLGVTYKKNVNDLRESPALEIIEMLQRKKALISYYDPFIPYLDIGGIRSKASELSGPMLKKHDIVVVVTDHDEVDYKLVAKSAKIIFDTRNVFERKGIGSSKVIKL